MNTNKPNGEQLTRLLTFAAWAVTNGWTTETTLAFVNMLTANWDEATFAAYELGMKVAEEIKAQG